MTNNSRTFSFFLASLLSVTAVAAAPAAPGRGMPVTVQDVSPAAREAVKIVDAFSAAIKAGRISEAGNLLDPKALILESGSSERSRAEYLQSHAIADVTFMQTVQQQLRYRQARLEGNVAWVGSESILETVGGGKAAAILSTETMVLRKGSAGWRIVHIHWSSRPAGTN